MKQVYVIDFGDKVKAGITDNIKRRISQIQCSAGSKAIRFASIQGDHALEHDLHKRLSKYHIAGEFYSCSFAFACSVLGECCGITIGKEKILFPDKKFPLRTGRPKLDKPKGIEVKARIDEDTDKRLQEFCKKHKRTRTDVVREGIELVLSQKK